MSLFGLVRLDQEPPTDIGLWYFAQMQRDGLCPNCGANFRAFCAEQNLYPHFTGACRQAVKP